jgi:hypothetical protein
MLIAQGESAKYVCDQMGHSSIQITFDTYGHLFPQAKPEAARRLQKSIFAARHEQTQLSAIVDALLPKPVGTGSGLGSKTQQNAGKSRPQERPN